ncbi:hypothetical protein [Sinorhizobium meliloti]|uniref:hypothetical protein n=1 Tax=Rhizobium meliloti TaxID=382 RepID=UPI000FD74458|nr:hypothetical protein [Sinorhizobium meliloti]RVN58491.1 hypothetical protein CN108_05495 [Sinorhizobium meliloti]
MREHTSKEVRVVFSPILSVDDLPEDEKYQAVLISELLARLSEELIKTLSHDLQLIQHAKDAAEQAERDKLALQERGPMPGNRFEEGLNYSMAVTGLARTITSLEHWAHIATKDALLTIFHCREVCVAVTDTLQQTRKLRKCVDLDNAIAIRKEICARVPNLVSMRHAIAHHGDHERDRVEKYRDEAPDEFSSAILWNDRMLQRQIRPSGWGCLSVREDNETMEFAFDQSLIDDLELIIVRFFDCFASASRPLGT